MDNFKDFLFEKSTDELCEAFLVRKNVWMQNRIMISVVLLIGGTAFLKFILGVDTMTSVILGLIIGLGYFKYQYIQLKNLGGKIQKYISKDFPNFAIAFCSMISTYDNITNVFENIGEYVDNKYIVHLLDEVNEINKYYPEEIEQTVFDFANQFDTINSMFFARMIIDFIDKGYDETIIDKLVLSLNVENDTIISQIVSSAQLSFVKFGTFPIMFSMIYIFVFVFVFAANVRKWG